ncbi:hypothetical protein [Botryobacter ruber]|uniref:hypothetical protein n=1 Tax=Botryobacter ruber TaxID=2171629 RepID=UPI001F0C3DF3|nr:hypothetical protein [Botryobacter ruber]
MKKEDFVLIPFPFTNLTGTKNRPALVLFGSDEDITVSFITTQLKWQKNLTSDLSHPKKMESKRLP